MAKVQKILRVEIDPIQPVSEICAVINEVTSCQPEQEQAILQKVYEAIGKRLDKLKGAEADAK